MSFCLYDVGVEKSNRKLIMALNKALKIAHEKCKLKIVKKNRPEYDTWPINHFDNNFKTHVRQVLLAVKGRVESTDIDEIINDYISYPVEKWGTTPFVDDLYFDIEKADSFLDELKGL